MLEYPKKDCWAIAFVTTEAKGEIAAKHKKELINLNTDMSILEQKVLLRNDRITELESLKTPPNQFWYTTAGFLVGSAATIAITYSVNQ
jgi:hypothetical protein